MTDTPYDAEEIQELKEFIAVRADRMDAKLDRISQELDKLIESIKRIEKQFDSARDTARNIRGTFSGPKSRLMDDLSASRPDARNINK